MNVTELLTCRDELEALLQSVGPVQFIRALRQRAERAQIVAYDSQHQSGQRSTRFVFVDATGAAAFLTVLSELAAAGQTLYRLECAPRPALAG